MMKRLRGRNLAHPGCLIGVTTGLSLGIILAAVLALQAPDLGHVTTRYSRCKTIDTAGHRDRRKLGSAEVCLPRPALSTEARRARPLGACRASPGAGL